MTLPSRPAYATQDQKRHPGHRQRLTVGRHRVERRHASSMSATPSGRREPSRRRSTPAGCWCFPASIDPHVHSRDPGLTHKEDFAHSTRAAAAGGVTTILEMPNVVPPVTSAAIFEERALHHGRVASVDFGLWGLALGPENLHEIEGLFTAGAVAVKLFWGYALHRTTRAARLQPGRRAGGGVDPAADQRRRARAVPRSRPRGRTAGRALRGPRHHRDGRGRARTSHRQLRRAAGDPTRTRLRRCRSRSPASSARRLAAASMSCTPRRRVVSRPCAALRRRARG